MIVDPDAQGTVLERVTPTGLPGEVIGKLASSRYYVSEDASVYSVAENLQRNAGISSVGVVNRERVPVGMVLRQELFDNLGRMHGRDLFKRRLVPEVMKEPKTIRDDLSIVTVADNLRDELKKSTSQYYVLLDGMGRYSGIFSTVDLLIYLSNITAQDISLARRLQTAIVKEHLTFSGRRTTILGFSSMAKEVGGDFYSVKKLADGKLLVAVCDVSGKGIAASLITAVLGGFFDHYHTGNEVKSFARSLNRYIISTFSLEYFVTGIIVEFDEDSGRATICDLGHSYMLVREDGKLKRLASGASNPPLGVLPDFEPVMQTHRLKPGSQIVLFTDGVVDQTDRMGRSYSEQRLWGLLRGLGDLEPRELASRLTGELASFRGEAPQRDDITFVVMEYHLASGTDPAP